MSIQWIRQLQPEEWPNGVIEKMDEDLFNECLIPLRQKTNVPFTPSPLVEGHIRTNTESRHSIYDRLSDATDVFIPSNVQSVSTVMREALRINKIGGFGLYFDTSPSVMFHIDMRPERLMWIRVDGEYIYEVNDPQYFYKELSSQLGDL